MEKIRSAAQLFLNYCRARWRMSKRTIYSYRQDLKCFILFGESLSPPLVLCDQWTEEVSGRYQSYLEAQFSPATVKRRIASLHTFASFLTDEGFLRDNPFGDFALRQRKGAIHASALRFDEVRQIRKIVYAEEAADYSLIDLYQAKNGYSLHAGDSISREVTWARDAAILELLMAAHLKLQEVCDLVVEDFDDKARTLRVRRAEGKDRVIGLKSSDAYWALHDYRFLRVQIHVDLPYLFISKFHTQMSTQAVRNLFKKYLFKTAEKKTDPSVPYRHMLARLLREQGLDVQYIQNHLGRGAIVAVRTGNASTDQQDRRLPTETSPQEEGP